MTTALLFNRISKQLNLKSTSMIVTKVKGGLMHQMYKLELNETAYAVKLLNPNIMKRSNALANFNSAEKLESIIERHKLPLVTALVIDGKKMQQFGDQYYYVYHWVEGNTLKDDEIELKHCQTIAMLLAKIHHIDKHEKLVERKISTIDWSLYEHLAKEKNEAIYKIIADNKQLLYQLQAKGNELSAALPPIVAIGHNDMDSKNVLWNYKGCNIIDLECLAYTNPYLEMFELALSWSGTESLHIDLTLFKAFIKTYLSYSKSIKLDWEALYSYNNAKLEWLEFNIKRVLMIESTSIEEARLGFEQVLKTINYLIYYSTIKQQLMECLTTL